MRPLFYFRATAGHGAPGPPGDRCHMDSDLLLRIRGLASGILDHEGIELVHLEMKQQGGRPFLRLYIDREGGITLDDCSRVSRRLSAELDIEDPIDGPYTLEVSSPGLDRPLFTDRDFERFAGARIRVRTAAPHLGRRNFSGRLAGISEGAVRLVLEGEREILLPRTAIAEARLVPDFDRLNAGERGRGQRA